MLLRRLDGPPPEVTRDALAIIRRVQDGGEGALLQILAERGQPVDDVAELRVDRAELGALSAPLPEPVLGALERAADSVRRFHQLQVPQTTGRAGSVIEDVRALDCVGICVPADGAGPATSVLMAAIPAAVAGVHRLVAAVPRRALGSSPALAAALQIAGVDEVWSLTGAPAIAALALGTGTLPRVQKIVGSGDIEVAAAKRLVAGAVGVDTFSGPPELVILLDGSSPPAWAAADLLAVAERDPMAVPVAITWDARVAQECARELGKQLEQLSRRSVAAEALRHHGAVFTTVSPEAACRLSDLIAPSQVALHTADAASRAGRLEHTAGLLVGAYSPEALGRYVAGSNHVLPTSGTARFGSGLGVHDFYRRRVRIQFSGAQLAAVAADLELLAAAEGFDGPATAVRLRRALETA